MNRENRLMAVRQVGGDWVGRVKGLSKDKKRQTNSDNSTVIARGKGAWGEVGGKVGINGDGRRLDLEW